jgi:hypothetical protein
MVRKTLLMLSILFIHFGYGQNTIIEIPENTSGNELHIDGLVQPILDDFLKICDTYKIDYHNKLFKLKQIAVVDSIGITPNGGTLGMLVRDKNNDVEKIIFSWVTLLDKEILKVVAFHEFGHYFLGYNHICDDCNKIMATQNTSYFDIILDWEAQVEILFRNSPEYRKTMNSFAYLTN